jgi:hypothetical protein
MTKFTGDQLLYHFPGLIRDRLVRPSKPAEFVKESFVTELRLESTKFNHGRRPCSGPDIAAACHDSNGCGGVSNAAGGTS